MLNNGKTFFSKKIKKRNNNKNEKNKKINKK